MLGFKEAFEKLQYEKAKSELDKLPEKERKEAGQYLLDKFQNHMYRFESSKSYQQAFQILKMMSKRERAAVATYTQDLSGELRDYYSGIISMIFSYQNYEEIRIATEQNLDTYKQMLKLMIESLPKKEKKELLNKRNQFYTEINDLISEMNIDMSEAMIAEENKDVKETNETFVEQTTTVESQDNKEVKESNETKEESKNKWEDWGVIEGDEGNIGKADPQNWQYYGTANEANNNNQETNKDKLPLNKDTAALKAALDAYHKLDKHGTGKIPKRINGLKEVISVINKLSKSAILTEEQTETMNNLKRSCIYQLENLQRIQAVLKSRLNARFPSTTKMALRRMLGFEFNPETKNKSDFKPNFHEPLDYYFKEDVKNDFPDRLNPGDGLMLAFKNGMVHLGSIERIPEDQRYFISSYFKDKSAPINNGSSAFVMDKEGNVHLGIFAGHSTAIGGQPVIAAGNMIFSKGKITHIDTGSGHYLPRMHHIRSCIKILQQIQPSPLADNLTIGNYDNSIVLSLKEFMECDLRKTFHERVYATFSPTPGKDSRKYVDVMPTREEVEALNEKVAELEKQLRMKEKKGISETKTTSETKQAHDSSSKGKRWLISFASQIKKMDPKERKEMIDMLRKQTPKSH